MRARHELQIKLNSYTHNGCNTFEDALLSVIYHNGALNLSWLPDDLIAEVRDLVIEREWSRYKHTRENRKRLASKERAA